MTHAELLRKHATDATNEGGMWFSGEYLSRIAETAESLEVENAKLRELVRGLVYATHPADRARLIADAAELGVEVD